MKLTTREICEIHDNINNWKWDKRLGEAPDGFYELRCFSKKRKEITKDTYIQPIMQEIHRRVSDYELYKYHHLCRLNRTEEEFERWWLETEPYGDQGSKEDIASVCGIVVFLLALLVLLNLFH